MLIWFCGGAWTARGVGCCMHAFFNHLAEFALLVRFVIILRLLIAVQLYEIYVGVHLMIIIDGSMNTRIISLAVETLDSKMNARL